MKVRALVFALCLVVAGFPAQAQDCTNPDGAKGDLLFNGDHDVFQGCTQRGWKAFHMPGSGPPPPSCPSTGLVSHWKLDESSGTSAADSAGSNTGTLTNGAGWAVGKINNAVNLDGSNDYVSIANPTTFNFGTADFTMSAWIKKTTTTGVNSKDWIVSKCHSAGTWQTKCKEFFTEWNGSNSVLAFGSYDTSQLNGATALDTNWHHAVVTFSDAPNTITLYLDGAFEASSTQALLADGAAHVVRIGLLDQNDATGAFGGLIDDMRIYNVALSAQDVADLYNGGAGCQ